MWVTLLRSRVLCFWVYKVRYATHDARASCHELRERFSSLMRTTCQPDTQFYLRGDALQALLEVDVQLLSLASPELVRQMFSSTILCRFLQQTSAERKLGTIFVFIVRRWFGVKESGESASVRWSTVKGRVFILLPELRTSWSWETQWQLDANLPLDFRQHDASNIATKIMEIINKLRKAWGENIYETPVNFHRPPFWAICRAK